jgi:hypothetical protein
LESYMPVREIRLTLDVEAVKVGVKKIGDEA